MIDVPVFKNSTAPGSILRDFEETFLPTHSSRESALLEAEQLAFNEGVGRATQLACKSCRRC